MAGGRTAASPRPKAGRHFTELPDDGTALAKLKIHLRDCLKGKTLRKVAEECGFAPSTLSKALGGTAGLPTRLLVNRLARTTGDKEKIACANTLWRLAAFEGLGLSPIDLVYPNPKTVAEFAAFLRGYLIDGEEQRYELTLEAVAMLTRHDKTVGRPLSVSTVNRMVSGKKLPSANALWAFLSAIGVSPTIQAKLFTAREAIAGRQGQVAA